MEARHSIILPGSELGIILSLVVLIGTIMIVIVNLGSYGNLIAFELWLPAAWALFSLFVRQEAELNNGDVSVVYRFSLLPFLSVQAYKIRENCIEVVKTGSSYKLTCETERGPAVIANNLNLADKNKLCKQFALFHNTRVLPSGAVD